MSTLKTETRAVEISSLSDGEDHSGCHALLEVLDRIGDKWTVMVVGVLAKGPTRFNAIQRAIGGISHRMLTRTLRGLERDGMVERRAFATIPPKVEYELSPMGRSLVSPLDTLMGWAQAHRPTIEVARSGFDDRSD
ncbi:helix-turn-helix domain-containing protein [Novosphingobium sp. AP12]|uniref:winged helix-turn-helix transcriptional regulator n=1 Tax=Novosphingobium sp. AP12 TaxID=1144305 RepID=UPI000271FB9F|nr:helix-turn-helix domain-containing protein [Novosphingobium sp. AP12]EJL22936.1 putative transcriptional regulator [Novosphingobium sp. AP12]